VKLSIVRLRCFVAVFLLDSFLFAQDDEEKKDVHQFTKLYNVEATLWVFIYNACYAFCCQSEIKFLI